MLSPQRLSPSHGALGPGSPTAASVASSLDSYISEFFESPTSRADMGSSPLVEKNEKNQEDVRPAAGDTLRGKKDSSNEEKVHHKDESRNPYGRRGGKASHHSNRNHRDKKCNVGDNSRGEGVDKTRSEPACDNSTLATVSPQRNQTREYQSPPGHKTPHHNRIHHHDTHAMTISSISSPSNTMPSTSGLYASDLVSSSASPSPCKVAPAHIAADSTTTEGTSHIPSSPMHAPSQQQQHHYEKRIRLKCHWQNGIRVVNVTRESSFQTVKQRLEADYGFEISLQYEDPDGDLITLSSQNDLLELVESCPSLRSSVTVHISHAARLPVSSLLMSPTPSVKQGSRLNPIHNMPSLPQLSADVDQDGGIKLMPQSLSSKVPLDSGVRSSMGLSSSMSILRSSHHSSKAYWHSKPRQVEPIRWQRGEVIGQGAYGTVYLGLNLDTGELMAVKQLDAKEVSEKELAVLENEIRLLIGQTIDEPKYGEAGGGTASEMRDSQGGTSKSMHSSHQGLNHPNIVRYLGMERSMETLSIFLEYVPGGSIRTLIDRFGALQEPLVRVYTRQLLLGLEYLHRNGIAHRDIKGANVLITNDGIVKLADFGASKRINTQNSYTQSGVKGTPLWMAPEVIKDQQTDKGWRRADVWSVGCTVIEMATGKPPWSQYSNPVTAMYHIACVETVPPFPENLSGPGHAFLARCFVRDPNKRPTVTDLLLDPFVTQLPAAQVRHLSNAINYGVHGYSHAGNSGSFPQRPSTGGRRRGPGRPRSSQYHLMSPANIVSQRNTSHLSSSVPTKLSGSVNGNPKGGHLVSPSPLTVPELSTMNTTDSSRNDDSVRQERLRQSAPASSSKVQSPGETVKETRSGVTRKVRLPQSPESSYREVDGLHHEEEEELASSSQLLKLNESVHNIHISNNDNKFVNEKVSKKRRRRKKHDSKQRGSKDRKRQARRYEQQQKPSPRPIMMTSTPRLSLFDGEDSEEDSEVDAVIDADGEVVKAIDEECVPSDVDNLENEDAHLDDDQQERLRSREKDDRNALSIKLQRVGSQVSIGKNDLHRSLNEELEESVVEGPPTPKGLLGAASKAAEEGVGLNLVLHDSPKASNSFPGAPISFSSRRSPRPEEKGTLESGKGLSTSIKDGISAPSQTIKMGQSQAASSQEKQRKILSSPEAALLNPRLSEELQEFRDQLGIDFMKGNARERNVVSTSSKGTTNAEAYEFSATPMTPRRRTGSKDKKKSTPGKTSTPKATRSKIKAPRNGSHKRPQTHDLRHRVKGDSDKISSIKRRISIDGSGLHNRRPKSEKSKSKSTLTEGTRSESRGVEEYKLSEDLARDSLDEDEDEDNTASETATFGKSPDFWVRQRRKQSRLDRKGLQTADSLTSNGSNGSHTEEEHAVHKTKRAGHRQKQRNRPASTMARKRGSLPDAHHQVSTKNMSSIRQSLTASPLNVRHKPNLGAIRGSKIFSRGHDCVSPGDSKSRGKSISEKLGASNIQRLSLLAQTDNGQDAARRIQKWFSERIRLTLRSSNQKCTTKRMDNEYSTRSKSGAKSPPLRSSKGSMPQKRNASLLPSYMRLLDTQPLEDTEKSGSQESSSDNGNPRIRSRELSGHTNTISEINVIRDNNEGKIAFASSSFDGTVRLWDTQTGEALSTLTHSPSEANSGNSSSSRTKRSSTNSSTLVSDSGTVSVLSLSTTKERSPSMFSGAADGSLWCWDVTMGKMTKRIRSAHSAPITSVKVAAMETARVVTGSSDNTVKVWDMRQKRPLVYTLRGHTAPISTLEVEPVWGRIFSGSKDQSLRVWDIRTGRPTHALQDHFGTVQCVLASPHVLHGFVSGARDSSIKFWNLEGQCTRTLRAHRGVVYSMALQPLTAVPGFGKVSNFNDLASSDNTKAREAWDKTNAQKFSDSTAGAPLSGLGGSSSTHRSMINTMRSSMTGPLLASGGADGKVRLWDCTRKKCVSEMEGHNGAVYVTKWASPGCVVSASADGTVKAWDVQTERCLTLEGHKGAVNQLHCDQDIILSASKDATMRLWSLGTAFGL